MMIESVRLKNIKSYSAAEISFKSGVNFIKGANGTGKTTLIEAVGFALFNVTSTGFAGGIHSYLLREGERDGEVCVRFSANGSDYEVVRTVSAEAPRRKWVISCEGEAAAGLMTDKDKVAFLQDAMGIPPEQKTDKLFTDMIGVKQGQFKAPFEYARQNRLEYFNAIFGVADFNRARENMAALRKNIQAKRAGLKSLSAALEGTVKQLGPKKVEMEALKAGMAKLEEEFSKLAALKKQAKETYDLARELEALEEKITLLREGGEKRTKEAGEAIRARKDEFSALQQEEKAAAGALSAFGETSASLQKVKDALAAVRKDAAGLSEYLRGTAEKIAYERESVIKSLEEAKAEAGKLENGTCPYFGETCEKMQGKQFLTRVEPLEEELKKTEERFAAALLRPRKMQWDAHVRSYGQAANIVGAALGTEDVQTGGAAAAFETFCGTGEGIEALYAALKDLEPYVRKEAEAFERHAERLAVRAGEINRDLSAKSAAAQKAVQSAQSALAEAQKRLDTVRDEMRSAKQSETRRDEIKKNLGSDAVDLKQAQGELLRLSGEAGRVEEQLRQDRKTIDSLARDIEEMEETRRKIEDHERQDKELARAASEAELLADLLRQAGGRVAELYTKKISAFAARMYAQVAEDGAVLRFDTEYDAKLADIYKGKERIRSFNQLSGGQRMIAALCVRIAMLTCFAGLPIAFFDEPTENIDAEKKQNLAQNLKSSLGGFSQIFIISHDDAFDRLTENVIYLEETREGTISGAL
jgi:exonuclease SbcC